MKFEVYEERMAVLGINRGALAPGEQFPEGTSTVVHAECGVDHRGSMKVELPPITEDLTRFVNQNLGRRRPEKLGRSGGARNFSAATRKFYQLLYRRTTSQKLADALEVSVELVGMAVRGHRYGRAVRERLLPLLTAAERAALPAMCQ